MKKTAQPHRKTRPATVSQTVPDNRIEAVSSGKLKGSQVKKEKYTVSTGRFDYDSAWKEIIEKLFPELLKLLFPNIYAEIDFSKGIEFLSQELRKIFPKNKIGKRLADVVAKVHLLDGSIGCVCVFIHVEVQGQPGKDFPERMFIYMYRLFDKFKDSVSEIISLAILTDEDVNYRPDEFRMSRWGFEIKMKIPVVKIIDWLHDEKKMAELENSDNPMALAVRAQLKNYEAKKLDDKKKFDIKKGFIKECYKEYSKKGYKRDTIDALLKFLDWLFEIPEELEQKLTDEIVKLEEEYKMPYVTSWERIGEKRGKEIGEKLGEKRGKEIGEKLGEKRGKEIGEKLGEKRGLKLGEERGKYKQAKETAKRLLKRKMPIDEIAACLGMTDDEIKKMIGPSPNQ